jgi:hypothetical protein
MALIVVSSIVQIFATDLLIVSESLGTLHPTLYMMKKHGWTLSQYEEYRKIYVSHISKIRVEENP